MTKNGDLRERSVVVIDDDDDDEAPPATSFQLANGAVVGAFSPSKNVRPPMYSHQHSFRRLSNGYGANMCYLNSVVQMLLRCNEGRGIADTPPFDKTTSSSSSVCASTSSALKKTVDEYHQAPPDGIVRLVAMPELVAQLNEQYGKGRMNDAAELLEAVLQFLDVEAVLLDASDAYERCVAFRSVCSGHCSACERHTAASSAKHFVRRVYAFNLIAVCCSHPQEDKTIDSFSQLVRLSESSSTPLVVKTQTPCEQCGYGFVQPTCVSQVPTHHVYLHVVWHTSVPSLEEMDVICCQALQDAFSTRGLEVGLDHQGKSSPETLSEMAVLHSMVLFRGQHYVCVVRDVGESDNNANRWWLLNDARPVRCVGTTWREMLQWAYKAKYVPMLLGADITHTTKRPSDRPSSDFLKGAEKKPSIRDLGQKTLTELWSQRVRQDTPPTHTANMSEPQLLNPPPDGPRHREKRSRVEVPEVADGGDELREICSRTPFHHVLPRQRRSGGEPKQDAPSRIRPLSGKTFVVYVSKDKRQQVCSDIESLGGTIRSLNDQTCRVVDSFLLIDLALLHRQAAAGIFHLPRILDPFTVLIRHYHTAMVRVEAIVAMTTKKCLWAEAAERFAVQRSALDVPQLIAQSHTAMDEQLHYDQK